MTSSAPQQALAPASPVWQAPGNGAQGSGQATGYFAHNGSVATGGNGLALIEKSQAEADDQGYSAGYDDAAPEETTPEFEQEFEPEAGLEPEQATAPEMEDEPEPAPEPVSEVAEPEPTPQTSDDRVTDPPQADKEPVAEAAQTAEPAMWNAEATLRSLPIAALVLNEVNSRFPKTETDMKPVDPTQPEAPAATDPTATDQHSTNGTSE
ncbi:MAG TPA: hypothetical protein VFO38_04750 [Candidatus Saccharimonadales bacterium]|nr:hypothetical protein [Candidatus Saccharimonadales bacterium]